MEGFWTVQFNGVQGFGAGVVTLINGHVLGGDSGFMYIGTYTQQENAFNAKVHVKPHIPGGANVMGRSDFDLELTGTMNGNKITVTGKIPSTPLQLNGTLTKQSDIAAKK